MVDKGKEVRIGEGNGGKPVTEMDVYRSNGINLLIKKPKSKVPLARKVKQGGKVESKVDSKDSFEASGKMASRRESDKTSLSTAVLEASDAVKKTRKPSHIDLDMYNKFSSTPLTKVPSKKGGRSNIPGTEEAVSSNPRYKPPGGKTPVKSKAATPSAKKMDSSPPPIPARSKPAAETKSKMSLEPPRATPAKKTEAKPVIKKVGSGKKPAAEKEVEEYIPEYDDDDVDFDDEDNFMLSRAAEQKAALARVKVPINKNLLQSLDIFKAGPKPEPRTRAPTLLGAKIEIKKGAAALDALKPTAEMTLAEKLETRRKYWAEKRKQEVI